VRVPKLFIFYVLNMLLGALLWTASFLLALVSLPLWCKRNDSSCATPPVLQKIALAFAQIDIRLANFTVVYLSDPKPSIRMSLRLEVDSGASSC
jgi:hypothetical protein